MAAGGNEGHVLVSLFYTKPLLMPHTYIAFKQSKINAHTASYSFDRNSESFLA